MAQFIQQKRVSLVAVGFLIVAVVVGFWATQQLVLPIADLQSIDTGNTAWVLAASALVMLMTPAVGLFYCGMVRGKNMVSVMNQSLVILALVSLQWVICGYSLVFGNELIGGFLGGGTFWFLNGVGYAPSDYASTIPQLAHMIFHAMFAAITPALIIGAFAERIRFRTLVAFVLLWSILVYDPIAHWVWGNGGWLRELGVLDFAGGTVVHTSSGFAALAAAWVVGKRLGRPEGEVIEAPNVTLVILGAAFLWFGWFGFNAGSAVEASPVAVNAFVVTNTSAAAAALTWMALSWLQYGRPTALATATGAVAGLVVATPGGGYVNPVSSIAMGITGGVVTYFMLKLRNKIWHVDDTLDVWAVHGMGGVTGVVLTGVFAEKVITAQSKEHLLGANGWLFDNWNLSQLGIQCLAMFVTAAYSFFVTLALVYILDKFMFLRVNSREETEGLDRGYRIEPDEELLDLQQS